MSGRIVMCAVPTFLHSIPRFIPRLNGLDCLVLERFLLLKAKDFAFTAKQFSS